jgi:DSF synthase
MNAISEQMNLLDREYNQLVTQFEPEFGIIWLTMKPSPRPCFTPELLENLREAQTLVKATGGMIAINAKLHSLNYLVLNSAVPGTFNLGGDLSLFKSLIVNWDREKLLRYATACIDVLYPNIVNYELPITTISLVQGDALGGGMEAALSSDIIIAEKHVQMGLPEVLFNLFPGMGAYSLITRRIGRQKAEQMILSGRIYSAEELHDIGLVDVIAESGQGEAAMYDWIKRQHRRRNTAQAMSQVRRRVDPVTYDELIAVTKIWVEAALRLEDKDLRMMDRLVRAQQKLNCEKTLPTSLPMAA